MQIITSCQPISSDQCGQICLSRRHRRNSSSPYVVSFEPNVTFHAFLDFIVSNVNLHTISFSFTRYSDVKLNTRFKTFWAKCNMEHTLLPKRHILPYTLRYENTKLLNTEKKHTKYTCKVEEKKHLNR
jgi:hypothetical protein